MAVVNVESPDDHMLYCIENYHNNLSQSLSQIMACTRSIYSMTVYVLADDSKFI